MNGLSQAQVDAQRREWTAEFDAGKQQIERLTREIEQLQQRLLALNGAIQACNLFSQQLESTPVSGEILDE
jgi:prefoldin subunit 5